MTIRSGAGGVDAADFAEMLMRMYTRWAEQHKYPVEVFDTSYAEEAGLKSATFAVHAPYAYGTLSVEAGTHRLVRISPFDNQGRRQTSFAAVEVVPVLEQTDEIEIPDEEIRIDVYRSGGPGGQSVNTTDSAVRLTHIPTGIVVSCQNEKSQLQNKASAMIVLKAKLLALKKAEEKAQLDEMRGDVQAIVGRPDAQLRAEPVPDRQGPAHRLRGRQPGGGLRRRARRLPRGRHPLAPRRREGRRQLGLAWFRDRRCAPSSTTETHRWSRRSRSNRLETTRLRAGGLGDLDAPAAGPVDQRRLVDAARRARSTEQLSQASPNSPWYDAVVAPSASHTTATDFWPNPGASGSGRQPLPRSSQPDQVRGAWRA